MLRLLCWNICSGPVDAQLAHLLHQPDLDVLVLTEYRRLSPRELPSPTLAITWPYQHTSVADWGPRGVLIASRHELEVLPVESLLDLGEHRNVLQASVTAVRIPAHDLTILGVYMPHAEGPAKQTLWAALHRYAADHTDDRFAIAGDMNSCVVADAQSGYASSPEALARMELVTADAWPKANSEVLTAADRYTWYSTRKEQRFGRRLDYVFLSRSLETALSTARHDQDVRVRGLSDHAALYVQLESARSLSS